MARGFNTTRGVGTTDKVIVEYAENHPIYTIACWTLRNGAGGNNVGEIVTKRTGATSYYTVNTNAFGTGRLVLVYNFSVQDGQWQSGANYFPTGAAVHNILTVDESVLLDEAPLLWKNNVAAAFTESIEPSGDIVTNTDKIVIGNRGDSLRCWDGDIAEFAMWNRALTEAERDLVYHYRPSAVPDGLVVYLPMVSAVTDTQNAAPTVTGTAVQEHPIPVMTDPGAQAGTEGEAFSLSLSCTDPEGDGLTWSLDGDSDALPSGLTLGTATVTGTPTESGTFDLIIRATDSRGIYDKVAITLTIAAAPEPDSAVDTQYYYYRRRN